PVSPATTGPSKRLAARPGVCTVARLSHRRLWRGQKLRLGAGAAGLVVATAVAGRYAGAAATGVSPSAAFDAGVQWGFFRLLVFVLPLLFVSGAVAEEVSARTLPLLTVRPVSRVAIACGKYLSGYGACALVLVSAMVALHLGLYATAPAALVSALPATLRATGALVLLCAYYAAVCLLWSALTPSAGGLVAGTYFATLELCGSVMPGPLRWISLNHAAQSLTTLPVGGLMPDRVPHAPPAVAVLLLAAFTALALACALAAFNEREYPT
ncbi:MAG: ABC transporter permease, partial [Myxococcales bacterium]|nr:ABC transporter permease [Myxococcales bacterium]